ncbi:MAG: phospholipase D family protein, partial [Pseudomonadota bacterium]
MHTTTAPLPDHRFFAGIRRRIRLQWLAPLFLGIWLAGCASLPDHVDRPISTALANPAETRIGSMVAQRAATASTRNDSGFALVGSAELAFTSRMTLIKAA